MANPMYSALCPVCGTALYGASGGYQRAICAACQWAGSALFHFLPSSQQSGGVSGGVGVLPNGATYPTLTPFASPHTLVTITNPLGPDEAEANTPDPLEARRAALGQRLYALASTVAEQLRTVDTEDWQMPAWRRYEHLQRAHEALYTALGGARMGDYHPARATLDERLADVLLWALLTLDAVER